MSRSHEPKEYVEFEGELLDHTDSAFKVGYGTKQVWVARSVCQDVEFLENGPDENQTIRCLIEDWIAERNDLV